MLLGVTVYFFVLLGVVIAYVCIVCFLSCCHCARHVMFGVLIVCLLLVSLTAGCCRICH